MSSDDIARSILGTVSYMVLATVDENGLPWASPIWFASDGSDDLYWISREDAPYSRNLAVRADTAIVVFDSRTEPATRQAVYMRATARRVDDPDAVLHGVAVFTRDSVNQGLGELTIDEVTGDADLRLYRARIHEHWILESDRDVRIRVRP